MFNKKKKNESFFEEEIIVATSKSDKKINRREEKTIIDIEIVDNVGRETKSYEVGNFTFYDTDPQNECSVDDSDIEEVKDLETNKSNKKDLSSFFEESKKYNSMMLQKEKREYKVSKNQSNVESKTLHTDSDAVYVFRNKEYIEVKDFIKYIDIHYLEIENISEEVLSDELFYEWLSKKSNTFDDSLKQFKDIKEKIEKK